jgi:hypothetical protein
MWLMWVGLTGAEMGVVASQHGQARFAVRGGRCNVDMIEHTTRPLAVMANAT